MPECRRAACAASSHLAAAALLSLLLGAQPAWTDEFTTQEARGEQIFRRGTSTSGETLKARVGGGNLAVNAALLPCINCHGADAKGRSEGGVNAANITWDALTKPYRVTTASDQGRPPYNDQLLVRAIALGFDSGGRDLDPSMPRYAMSRQDILDLIAYLKVLGKTEAPGVAASRLTLMLVLPPTGKASGFGLAIKQVLSQFFDRVNAAGGIYGRQVVMKFFHLPEESEATVTALASYLDASQPLALVASYMSGREHEITDVLEQKWIPGSGAFTLLPPVAKSRAGPVFYLFPGLVGEGHALARAFRQDTAPQATRVAVVYEERELWTQAADAIALELRNHPEIEVQSVAIPMNEPFEFDVLARELEEMGTTAVFLLAPGETGRRLVRAVSASSWRPAYYAPALIAEGVFAKIPPAAGSPLHLSWSTLPADQNPDAMEEFLGLVNQADLQASAYPMEQMHALAAAKVLLEGLRRAGRDVTRQKLVSSLEELYDFSTGLTPNITFGPNRRIGAGGTYVIEYDVGSSREVRRRWIKSD